MNIELIVQKERLEALQKEWDDLFHRAECRYPFLSHAWFVSWFFQLAQGKTLQTLLTRDNDGKLLGIAPLMREGSRLHFLAGREVTDYCDFLYPVDSGKHYFDSLLQYIRTRMPQISGLDLINIPSDSSTLNILMETSDRFGWRYILKKSETSPFILLPSSYHQYIKELSRKQRHELRRKLKKVGSIPDVRIKRICLPDKINKYVDAFIGMHGESSPEKCRFWEAPGMTGFFHIIAKRFSENGWLELLFLYGGSTVLAGLISFSYRRTVFLYNLAFNREYSRYSPGIYLVNERIRSAISEGFERVDFLRGEEKYKYDFGAQDSKIMDLQIEFGEISK